jgi:predicted DNA-binding protein (UPF0251 family)
MGKIKMPRPKKHRCTSCRPEAYYFKPRGIPMWKLEEVILEKDELEAIKLADYDNMSHEDAAGKMEISRATFGRILQNARNKMAESVLKGKAIRIS